MAYSSNASPIPVSVVIPLYNAEKTIVKVINAVLDQDYAGVKEIIVVNDGSRDLSRELLRSFESSGKVKVIDQVNKGAVAATNAGFETAQFSIICSVDSDVVLHRDWLSKVMREFDDPFVGAVQGYYKTPGKISFWGRMMGYDVEKRYDDIKSKYVTQVCTGDTAYRASSLDKTGLFDPAFIYGYDNDMSYRLQKAGFKLVFLRDALCDHYWKADFSGYIRQQYRSAYGRMQLVTKHTDRVTGDSVSGLRMIMQVPVTFLSFALLIAGALIKAIGFSSAVWWSGVLLLAGLLIDRILFTISVVRKQRDVSALFLPAVHLLRNAAWTWAMLSWVMRGSNQKR